MAEPNDGCPTEEDMTLRGESGLPLASRSDDAWRHQAGGELDEEAPQSCLPLGELDEDTFSELDQHDIMPSGHFSSSLPTLDLTGSTFNAFDGTSAASSAPAPMADDLPPAMGAHILKLADTIPEDQRPRGKGQRDRAQKEKLHRFRQADPDGNITKKELPWSCVTTVMMRNLPNKYTQQMLMEELQEVGFHGQSEFDFFYLPMDHNNAANLGYCFINFVSTAVANVFGSAFQGKKMRRFNSSKTVVVMPASIQGFDENYAYYSSTRVAQAQDPQYRPLFLRPPPTNEALQQAQIRAGVRGKGSGMPGEKGGKGRRGKDGKDASGTGGKGGKRQSAKGPSSQASGADGQWPQVPQMQASMPQPYNMRSAPPYDMRSAPPQSAPSGPLVAEQVCLACGKSCGPSHRFCAFCGSAVLQAISGSSGGGFGNSGLGSMRASAPAFHMPDSAPGPHGGSVVQNRPNMFPDPMPAHMAPTRHVAPTQMPMQFSSAPAPQMQTQWPMQQQQQFNAGPQSHIQPPRQMMDPNNGDPGNAFRYNDASVGEQYDVMRGRAMLLAALKDMETSDGRGPGVNVGTGPGIPFMNDTRAPGMNNARDGGMNNSYLGAVPQFEDRNFPKGTFGTSPFSAAPFSNGDPVAGPLPDRSTPAGYGPPGRRPDW